MEPAPTKTKTAADGTIHLTLRDGREVRVRPVRPDDKPLFVEGFEGLSDDSRYLRFFGTKKALSDDELCYLTEVDGVRHVALGALDEDGHGVGVARYVVLDEPSTVAEVAVTVLDAYQGQGLGHRLLELLVEAARAGHVHTLRFWVLAANTGMIHVLKDLGARWTGADGPSQRWDLDVSS